MGIVGTVSKLALTLGSEFCAVSVTSEVLHSVLPALPETANAIDKIVRFVGIAAIGGAVGDAVATSTATCFDKGASFFSEPKQSDTKPTYEV